MVTLCHRVTFPVPGHLLNKPLWSDRNQTELYSITRGIDQYCIYSIWASHHPSPLQPPAQMWIQAILHFIVSILPVVLDLLKFL